MRPLLLLLSLVGGTAALLLLLLLLHCVCIVVVMMVVMLLMQIGRYQGIANDTGTGASIGTATAAKVLALAAHGTRSGRQELEAGREGTQGACSGARRRRERVEGRSCRRNGSAACCMLLLLQ